jgi:uncharacterized protein YndB with AHSA1/START domain
MKPNEKTVISVYATINEPIDKVWKNFTAPEDILKWNNASEDWHTTSATNELHAGGKFNYRMEAKDGSFGFDFWGIYDEVIENEKLVSTLGDGRKLEIKFNSLHKVTEIMESFEAEAENPVELQRGGWQAILDNFKRYTETY